MPKQVFALLTDFGLGDPYLAQMKGVLLQGVPECTFLDISHMVLPQRIEQAGFFLCSSWSYLPPGSICLAVVDPGVGTQRRILYLYKQGRGVLAPDNGLLHRLLGTPGGQRIFDLSPQQPVKDISATFHGRDVFARIAVELVQGRVPLATCPELNQEDLVATAQAPPVESEGTLRAAVLHIDRFGNCILDLSTAAWAHRLEQAGRLQLLSPAAGPLFPAKTYAEIPHGGVGLLQGSQGCYELACRGDSCAEKTGLGIGDTVQFSMASPLW